MHNRAIKSLNQAGDTIVEVMVVLAILGMAIGVSYATANRSLLNVRQAEQNSYATDLVQTQIEALRTFVQYTTTGPAPTQDIFTTTSPGFCISISAASSTVVRLPTADPTSFSSYIPADSACIITNGGTKYYVADSYNATGSSDFQVEVAWYDILGQGKDTVTLSYNLYQ